MGYPLLLRWLVYIQSRSQLLLRCARGCGGIHRVPDIGGPGQENVRGTVSSMLYNHVDILTFMIK